MKGFLGSLSAPSILEAREHPKKPPCIKAGGPPADKPPKTRSSRALKVVVPLCQAHICADPVPGARAQNKCYRALNKSVRILDSDQFGLGFWIQAFRTDLQPRCKPLSAAIELTYQSHSIRPSMVSVQFNRGELRARWPWGDTSLCAFPMSRWQCFVTALVSSWQSLSVQVYQHGSQITSSWWC